MKNGKKPPKDDLIEYSTNSRLGKKFQLPKVNIAKNIIDNVNKVGKDYEGLFVIFGFLGLIIGVVGVYMAYDANKIAKVAVDQSNIQFEINAREGDSLFKVQLKNEKELNDNLIQQVSSLQIITEQQLQITETQSRILQNQLDENIYQKRADLQIYSSKVDSIVFEGEQYLINFRLQLKNNGARNVNQLTLRIFYAVEPLKDKVFFHSNTSYGTIQKDVRIQPYVEIEVGKKEYESDRFIALCLVAEYEDKDLGTKRAVSFQRIKKSNGKKMTAFTGSDIRIFKNSIVSYCNENGLTQPSFNNL